MPDPEKEGKTLLGPTPQHPVSIRREEIKRGRYVARRGKRSGAALRRPSESMANVGMDNPSFTLLVSCALTSRSFKPRKADRHRPELARLVVLDISRITIRPSPTNLFVPCSKARSHYFCGDYSPINLCLKLPRLCSSVLDLEIS